MFVRELLSGFLDLLAPRRCPGCDTWLEELSPFCEACRPLLEKLPSSPTEPFPVASVFQYGGPLADAIRKLKYQGRTDLTSSLAGLLMEGIDGYRGAIDAVIPVPLHPKRLRARGFNQSALLANRVAKALDVRMVVNTLIRVKHTPPQVDLDLAARIENVKGAFFSRPSPLNRRVLIVDDVKTTGATLAEAAFAMQKSGAEKIYCLALAQSALG
ncbi:MAG: ComF family protein [Myxococcales bacterium]|nr:ComF family protein [Myxococcales bacterium]MCB9709010.1 ComF family protein [Myxococcales bacterium]